MSVTPACLTGQPAQGRRARGWVVLAAAALAVASSAVWAGGASPAECAALRAQYQDAVAQAQVCDPQVSGSCEALRPAALDDPCRCQVGVNPARVKALDALAATYRAKACVAEPQICRRMCTQPGQACVARPGASTATCAPADKAPTTP